MPSAFELSVLTANFALRGITFDLVKQQLPSLCPPQYLNDFLASSNTSGVVQIIKSSLAVCSHATIESLAKVELGSGAMGGKLKKNFAKNNLELLSDHRSLFTILIAMASLDWLSTGCVASLDITNDEIWNLNYEEWFVNSKLVVTAKEDDGIDSTPAAGASSVVKVTKSGGPSKEVSAIFKANDNATKTAKKKIQNVLQRSTQATHSFTVKSSWPELLSSHLAPLLFNRLSDNLKKSSSTSRRVGEDMDVEANADSALAAGALEGMLGNDLSKLSLHSRAILSTTSTNKRQFFGRQHKSDDPVLSFGLFNSGCDFDDYRKLLAALDSSTALSKNGQAWGVWYFNQLLPAAHNCGFGYSSRLENKETSGRRGIPLSLKSYINSSAEIIAFLIYEKKLVLPAFSSVNDGSFVAALDSDRFDEDALSFFERINAIVLKFTCSKTMEGLVLKFIRWQLIKWDKDYSTFVTKSIATVSKKTSAIFACFKIQWQAAYVGHRDSGESLIPGLSMAETQAVLSGKMSECYCGITLFTLRSWCSKFQDSGTVFEVLPDPSAKGDNLAAWVGGKYMSCAFIKDVMDSLIVSSRDKMKDLFRDSNEALGDAICGKHKITIVDTNGMDEPSFSFALPATSTDGDVGEIITSSQLKVELLANLKSKTAKDFRIFKSIYFAIGNHLQAALGLSSPKRETEISNLVRLSDDSCGLARKLKFLNSHRSDCDTVGQGLAIRTKTKFGGSGAQKYMITLLTPDLSLLLLIFSVMRQPIVDADAHFSGKPLNTDMMEYLFVDSAGKKQGDGVGASNFRNQIAATVKTIKESGGSASALDAKQLVPFTALSIRHFFEFVTSNCLDEISNIEGGVAQSVRKSVAVQDLSGHSEETSDYYTDNGAYHSSSISVNQSTMLSAMALNLRVHKKFGFGRTVKGRERSPKHFEASQFNCLADVVGCVVNETFDARFKKWKAYLIKNKGFLSAALGRGFNGNVTWRPAVLDSTAAILAADAVLPSETRERRDVKMFVPQGVGKTVCPIVVALLHKTLLRSSSSGGCCFVMLYVNRLVQRNGSQEFVRGGVEVYNASESSELANNLRSTDETGSIMSTVIDSALDRAQNYINSLIRSGVIVRFFIDEPQDIPSQSFREIMGTLTRFMHSQTMKNVSLTLMTGSCNFEMEKELDLRLGIDSNSLVFKFSHPPLAVRNYNIKYTAIVSGSFASAAASACDAAEDCHEKGAMHLLGVLTNKHAEQVAVMLGQRGIKTFVNSQGRKDELGANYVEGVVLQWVAGEADFFVLVTTQPVAGWNPRKLLKSDWLGCWGLLGACQSATRVGRDGFSLSESRFHSWPNWEKSCQKASDLESDESEEEDDDVIFVMDVKSFNELFKSNCLRSVLALTTELATEDREVDLDNGLKNCSFFASAFPYLQVQSCSVCCPPSRADVRLRSPSKNASPAKRSRTSEASRASECRNAVMERAAKLRSNNTCFFCGVNCGSENNEGKSACPRLFAVTRNRCSRCFGNHSVSACQLNVASACKDICTLCFNPGCTMWRHEGSVEDDDALKQSCVNSNGEDSSRGFSSLGVLTNAVFNNERDLTAWLDAYGFNGAARSLEDSLTAAGKFAWLFSDVVDSRADVKHYNLAFCWWWSSGGTATNSSFKHDLDMDWEPTGFFPKVTRIIFDGGSGSGINPTKATPIKNPYANSAKAPLTSKPYSPQQIGRIGPSPNAGSSSGKPPPTPAFQKSYSSSEDQWYCYRCGYRNYVSKQLCTNYHCGISQLANHTEETRLGKRNKDPGRLNEVNLFDDKN
jgi:hypothetical protein